MCHCTLLNYITLFAVFEFWYIFYPPTLRKTCRFLYPGIESCLILKKYLSLLGHCKIIGICLQMVCKVSYVPLNAENCLQNVKKIFFFYYFLRIFDLVGKKCLHKLNFSILKCKRFSFSSRVRKYEELLLLLWGRLGHWR